MTVGVAVKVNDAPLSTVVNKIEAAFVDETTKSDANPLVGPDNPLTAMVHTIGTPTRTGLP
jgi:hypothetical protein